MKYSDAPWRYQVMGSEGARIYSDTGDKRKDLRCIAAVSGMELPEDRANAALMAAAPELLDALKEALDMLKDAPDDEAYFVELKARCTAAIDKAEGK